MSPDMHRDQSEKEKEEIRRRIGDAIRQRREELGLSQERAALVGGSARSYFAEVEKGKRNPTATNLVKIAAGLELTAAELLDRAGI